MRTACLTASLVLLGTLSGSLRGDEPLAQDAARTETTEETKDAKTTEDTKDEKTYTVWMRSLRVRESRTGFSRFYNVPEGTRLELLAKDGSWTQVGWKQATERKTGWAILPPPKLSAGELRDELGDVMAASIALTLKGFGDFVRGLAKENPKSVATLAAYESAYLEEDDVKEFVREGKLELKERK